MLSITLGFLLFSCDEYHASYPAGPDNEASNYEAYMGDWQFLDYVEDPLNKYQSTYDPHAFRLMRFNDREFLMEYIPEDDSKVTVREYVKDLHLIRGWLSTIDGKLFVNLTPIGREMEEPTFFVHRIALQGDTLIATTLSARLFTELGVEINSVSEHTAFIKSIADSTQYWNTRYRYIRQQPTEDDN